MLERISEEFINKRKVITYSDGSQAVMSLNGNDIADSVSFAFSRAWDNLSVMQQKKINRDVLNERRKNNAVNNR